MPVDHTHVGAIADEMDESLGRGAEPRIVAALYLDVPLERREAADRAFRAFDRRVIAHGSAMFALLGRPSQQTNTSARPNMEGSSIAKGEVGSTPPGPYLRFCVVVSDVMTSPAFFGPSES